MSRASAVLGLYGAMALGAILLSAGRGDPDVYRLPGEHSTLWLVLSPPLGVAVGLAFVGLTRLAVERFAWAQMLSRSFHDLLGPLAQREIVILALASSVGEEFLFRGALQPWLGLAPQALLFALLHVGPGKRFLPWTLSALVMGAAFGWLAELSGNLGGSIAAHFTINFLNLRFIVAAPSDSERWLARRGD
jgi:uncharacterized protein